jgi:DNA replication protein DnaC
MIRPVTAEFSPRRRRSITSGGVFLSRGRGSRTCRQRWAWLPAPRGARSASSASPELITLLLEAKEERQLLRLRQQLGKLDLLILDELGYVPASKAGAELLFDVIATAYELNSLIVTTNLPFENWTEVLGSERLTGAALDRLTHRCHILETNGESFRLQDAKRRRGRAG